MYNTKSNSDRKRLGKDKGGGSKGTQISIYVSPRKQK